MSYLVLPKGITDFHKATLSLWFRIPTPTLNAVADQVAAENAKADAEGDDYVAPQLLGIIPLMVWGNSSYEGYTLKTEITRTQTTTDTPCNVDAFCVVRCGDPTTSNHDITQWAKDKKTNVDPSHIGIYYDRSGPPQLSIRIQMSKQGTGAGLLGANQYTYSDTVRLFNGNFFECGPRSSLYYAGLGCVNWNYIEGGDLDINATWLDQSDLQLAAFGPEAFGGIIPNVTMHADTWHHLLVAVDLSGTVSAEGGSSILSANDCDTGEVTVSIGPGSKSAHSSAKMYLALDDKNITPVDPFSSFTNGVHGNDIITFNASAAAAASNIEQPFTTYWQSVGLRLVRHADVPIMPSFSYTPSAIPADGYPLGIPATPKFVDNIRMVEMAEFQMFTGVTMDTSDEKSRRAFIDANGKPVPPTKKPSPGDETYGSIALLGKRPDILLHGSGNWKSGHNTGSTGTDSQGTKIPAGQFGHTGVIKAYKPDPSLHGPQSPPPGKAAAVRLSRKPVRNRVSAE